MAPELPPPLAAGSSPATSWNMEYIESMYARWKENPANVSESWQIFFTGFELAMCPRDCIAAKAAHAQSNVNRLIAAYRGQGHRLAAVDPLGNNLSRLPELELKEFEFSEADYARAFDTGFRHDPRRATLKDILAILQDTYCRAVGVEYRHIQDPAARERLETRMESTRNRPAFDRDRKMEVLRRLLDAELFETFLHNHYPGQKRFSLEGAETLIPMLHAIIERSPEAGVAELVLGMTHRGRLNVLATLFKKSYAAIFSEFEDNYIPDSVYGSGDVKYHKGYSAELTTASGQKLAISLTHNPSHLEAVDPVVQGRTRAKQRQHGDTIERKKVVPVLMHGDAAFAGQGIVAETFNLSGLAGYRTGGTLHIVINNQIGFTATAEEERSTIYATDVAKMVEAPIFHVNGDDPESAVHVAELALDYRQTFGRDVVIDMLCYRRHGHNEGDDPEYTQPAMYRRIKNHPPVRKIYTARLIESGDLSPEEEEDLAREMKTRLTEAFEQVKKGPPEPDSSQLTPLWDNLRNPYAFTPVETGVRHDELVKVATGLCTVPPGFNLNPKVARKLQQQLAAVRELGQADWGLAELLSIGSLLAEGVPVRLSGQDSARGTFSHRHAVWYDMETGGPYVPANAIGPGQAHFCVYNSMLSEAAVLGFDYGYAVAEPRMLVIWEAQFGDFANGAQVIIDNFVVASESKWKQPSGIVLLLPHGFEGQGPEHSNAYLERYLAACAEENIQVCHPTTPAQYFHLLRRQMKRPFRRPLIVMSPKSLLRHKRAQSGVRELAQGRFEEFLDDPAPVAKPKRLVLCSGKIFYDLLEKREKTEPPQTTLVRVEQFYPFHEALIKKILGRYKGVKEAFWVQEEPENRGGWGFMKPRLQALLPGVEVGYIGRKASASPAAGLLRQHHLEQAEIVAKAIL